jgi:hypothetical protein
MSSFPLRTVILPAVLISSSVFSTLTLPFVLLKEPIAIDIPPFLSGGRIEPMFDAENKDVAIRYVGIAILLSVGAGIGTVEFLRARHSAQELTQAKSQLSSLKLSLQEKAGLTDSSNPSDLDADLSDDPDNISFEEGFDEQEASLTSTFDQYVAAENLGQNIDAFPLVSSESFQSVEASDPAIAPSLNFTSLPLEGTVQLDVNPNDSTQSVQNGAEPLNLETHHKNLADLAQTDHLEQDPLESNLAPGAAATDSTPANFAPDDLAQPWAKDGEAALSELQTSPVQNGASPTDLFHSGFLKPPAQDTLGEEASQNEAVTADQILASREQYQTCRVRVPDLQRCLFAVQVQGEYYSLFRSGATQAKALAIATKLKGKGNKPIVTQTEKGHAVWVWQPKADVDQPHSH